MAEEDVWRERGRVPVVFLTEALSQTSCAQLTRSSLSYLQMQAFIAVRVPEQLLLVLQALAHRLPVFICPTKLNLSFNVSSDSFIIEEHFAAINS